MRRRVSILLLVAACTTVFVLVSPGQFQWAGQADPAKAANSASNATTSPNYRIDWYSTNGGGATQITSPNYSIGSSSAQSLAGQMGDSGAGAGIGFWNGDCICYCPHDPVCDGYCDVLDVVETINVAFRGHPPIVDPSQLCPWQTTDMNCTQTTDLVDVVIIVNCAFRAGIPDDIFCIPCR